MVKVLKKKLIYILNSYNEKEATHFRHSVRLLKYMGRKDYQISLIIEKANDLPFISENVKVYLLRKGIVARYISLAWLLLRLRLKGYKNIYIRISKYTAFIVGILSKVIGVKLFFWQSGATYELERAKKRSLIGKLKYSLFNEEMVKAISFLSEKFVTGPESMVGYYNRILGIPFNKLYCMYNDIDTDVFRPLGREKRIELKGRLGYEKDFVFLYVKRFSPVKGTNFYFPELIERFKNYEGESVIRFVLIGGGDLADELKETLAQVSKTLPDRIKVDYLGKIPNDDLIKYYQIADVFLNLSFEEGFPRVLLEAMACGTASISTDVGGARDILDFMSLKTTLHDAHNLNSIYDNMLRYIKDTNYLAQISKESLKRVKKYSTSEVVKMYDTLFEAK